MHVKTKQTKLSYPIISLMHAFSTTRCVLEIFTLIPWTNVITLLFKCFLLVCPIWLPFFRSFFSNMPGLSAGIDPGMSLTPFPSSIGWASIQTYDLSIVSRVRYPLSTSTKPSYLVFVNDLLHNHHFVHAGKLANIVECALGILDRAVGKHRPTIGNPCSWCRNVQWWLLF